MGSKVSFAVVDPGNGPRGPELSLVLDQTESRRVWMTVPPPHSHLSEGLDLLLIWFICSFGVQLPPMSGIAVLIVLGHFSSFFRDSKGFCVLFMLVIIDHKL